ncbi:MAG: hypothetical protein J6A96_00240 [Clostridia bacterium]|nr:hypothetical protein [Clostridia bacterium]
MNMQITPLNKRPLKIGDVNLSWPDFIFIILSNAAVIMVIINAILNKSGFWCYYPILGSYYAYIIVYASFAGTAKKFLSRFRNGTFILNLLFTIIALIHWLTTGFDADGFNSHPLVAYEWILPIILIISLFVVLGTAFFKTVTLLNLLVATSLMLPQVTGVFIFAVTQRYTIYSDVSFVLSVVMFALYLMVIANLAFLHIVKVRNKIDDAMQKKQTTNQ